MTTWRWGTSGVPGLSAFMPAISKTAGVSQSYKEHVHGSPGTTRVPAPNNNIPQDRLQVSADHRSSDAPPYWFPQLWYQDKLPGLPFPAGANDAGVCIYSDNALPVPAIDSTRIPPTYRYGGGKVVQPYQNTFRRAVTERTVQPRYA